MNQSLNSLRCRLQTYREHNLEQEKRFYSTYDAKLNKERQETLMLQKQYLSNVANSNSNSKSKSTKNGGGGSGSGGRGTKRQNSAVNGNSNCNIAIQAVTVAATVSNEPIMIQSPTVSVHPQMNGMQMNNQMVMETNYLENLGADDLKELYTSPIKEEPFDNILDNLSTDDFTDPEFIKMFLKEIETNSDLLLDLMPINNSTHNNQQHHLVMNSNANNHQIAHHYQPQPSQQGPQHHQQAQPQLLIQPQQQHHNMVTNNQNNLYMQQQQQHYVPQPQQRAQPQRHIPNNNLLITSSQCMQPQQMQQPSYHSQPSNGYSNYYYY